jgi:hypothetical protein
VDFLQVTRDNKAVVGILDEKSRVPVPTSRLRCLLKELLSKPAKYFKTMSWHFQFSKEEKAVILIFPNKLHKLAMILSLKPFSMLQRETFKAKINI